MMMMSVVQEAACGTGEVPEESVASLVTIMAMVSD